MQKSQLVFGKNPTQPLVIVISGPSGIGKDAVVGLLQKTNCNTHFVITVNSRAPRKDEINGKDYFFVSRQEFERMIEAGELLEHARVYSDYKGIPKSQVREALASGKDVVMRLDVQGAMTVKKLIPDALLIFLTASSKEEWINRLQARSSESTDELALRLRIAEDEYARLADFDYLVVNSDRHLDKTIEDIQAIIHAEHLRTKPRKVSL
ncbi:MAG: guanylate kinase [Anaerolineaceae bacterium]|nr:guanylate kinase [Anaerolineaceae bacterium]